MDETNFSDPQVKKLAAWLKLLGEPNRLLLLGSIINGLQCNCEIGKSLGLSPNLISHHLSALHEAGIIKAEKNLIDARWTFYSINEQAVDEINDLVARFFDKDRVQPRKPGCEPRELINKTKA